MSRRGGKGFWLNESGATAAVYALALPALVAIGGVGFDYARLAGMDSELQNAADQAALAGATQLDGETNARTNATIAACTLVTNRTLLANDNDGLKVTSDDGAGGCIGIDQVLFWQDKDRTNAATSDADAHFVEIILEDRTANYALTPIAGAFFGDIVAAAMAGLGSSICKVPPVMLCNPAESTDPDFVVGNYVGKGLRLVANDGGSNYAPGNFGYLETNAGNGAQATAQTLGREDVPGDCVAADGVTTKPGVQISVLDALNTRFDVYANGLNNACGTNKALCPPSANSRKDVMLNTNANSCTNGCGFQAGGGNGWKIPPNPYLPSSGTTPLTSAQYSVLSPMGYPRDMCHAVSLTGSCSGGRIGDGNWDRAAYFGTNTTNYSSVPTSGEMISMFGTDIPSRYQVYRYEAAAAMTRLQSQAQGGMTGYGQPAPNASAGVPVGGASPDRRVLSVAVINCTAEGVQGRSVGVDVVNWIDVFLVEPALPRARTESSDVYVEVIGETSLGGGGSTSAQNIRRDVPYLVR
jgi:hypothetical protein